ADKTSVTEQDIKDVKKNIFNIIPNIDKKEYRNKFEIIDGELVYIGSIANEIKWSNELNILTKELIINISTIVNETSIAGTVNIHGAIADCKNVEKYEIYISKNKNNFTDLNKLTFTDKVLNQEYTFNNLESNNIYYIKTVITINKNTYTKITNKLLTKKELISPIITNLSLPDFKNTDVDLSIGIKDNIGGSGLNKNKCKYILNNVSTKYDVNDDIWNNANIFELNSYTNDTVNLKLINLTDNTYYLHVLATDNLNNKTTEISNKMIIDKTKPNSLIYSPNTLTNVQSGNIKITATDNLSGINNIKYVCLNTNVKPDESVYTNTIINGETITLTNETETKYIHTLVTDNAGNKEKFVSGSYKLHVHTSSCEEINYDVYHQTFNGGFTQNDWNVYTTAYGSYQRIYAGLNTINLTSNITRNKYVNIYLTAANLTCTQSYSNFNILINGEWMTINDAGSRGLIEKIVATDSIPNYYTPHPYPQNILNGGNTGQCQWNGVNCKFKLLNSTITSMRFNVEYNSRPGDGFSVMSGDMIYTCGF
ncbi:MAG: hypothetical protein RSE41_04995, partial [Clostridia bacterium]